MTAIAIIPARYASARMPGKPLADRTGKPLIQHVVERVRQARRIDRVLVATDDRRILEAVRRLGGEAAMTRGDHPNGTSRIAEVIDRLRCSAAPTTEAGRTQRLDESSPAADRNRIRGSATFKNLDHDIVVNVQGDEPEIEPAVIDQLVEALIADPGVPMATIASEFAPDEDPADPNIVKVIVNQAGRAIYFSRSLIPYDRNGQGQVRPLKHVGLYAYRRNFLLKYVTLTPTPLEQTESLEQLRALEHGYAINVIKASVRHHGIDTPGQYEAFVQRHQCGANT